MPTNHFTSSAQHLCQFMEATGNSWRNTLYIECGNCPRACSRDCQDMLCAFTVDATPVMIPVQEAERLWRLTIDKSECLSILPRTVFLELYKNWVLHNIRDPHSCFLREIQADKT